MKSIAYYTLTLLVYVLEFTIGVFLFPVCLMQGLLFLLEEGRYTLSSEGERSDPSKREGG